MKIRFNSVGTKVTAILLFLGGCILAIVFLASTTFRHIEQEIPLTIHLGNIDQLTVDLKTAAIQYIHSGSETSRASIENLIVRWDNAIDHLLTGGQIEIDGEPMHFGKIDANFLGDHVETIRKEWRSLKPRLAQIVQTRGSIATLHAELLIRSDRLKEKVYALSDRFESLGERYAPSAKLCDSLITHEERLHGLVINLFATEVPTMADVHRGTMREIAVVTGNILLWIRQGNGELNVSALEDAQAIPLLSALEGTVKAQNESVERIVNLWISLIDILQTVKKDSETMLFLTHLTAKELIGHHVAEIRGVEKIAFHIFILAIVLTILAVVATYRYLVKPLRDLTRATREIAAGRTDIVLTPRTSDEIGVLTENFQKMAADLRLLHEQLIQASKLSSLGVMTAGIAHEINNPLAGIMGYAQLSL